MLPATVLGNDLWDLIVLIVVVLIVIYIALAVLGRRRL